MIGSHDPGGYCRYNYTMSVGKHTLKNSNFTAMKFLLPILLLFAGLPVAARGSVASDSLPQPREYQVVSAKGRIVQQRSGKTLSRRSIFHEKDVLVFDNQDSRLALIDHRQQSFIAKPGNNQLGYFLEPLRASVNTRPGKILNFLAFRQFLEGRRLLAIGDSLALEIGDETFAMNSDSFFYVQYHRAGDPEPINKRLAFADRLLIFDRTSLFTVDGQPIDPAQTSDYKLYYYNSVANTSTLINQFDLIFGDEEVLREEVDVIVKNFNADAPKGQIRQAVTQYIEQLYGEPLKSDLEVWLGRWWGL